MKRILLTLVISTAVAGSHNASASLIIDHFSLGSGTHLNADQSHPTAASIVVAGDAIGGTRYVGVQWDSGDGTPSSVAADNLPPAGVISFTSKTSNRGSYFLDYSQGGSGLGGIDFTQGGTVQGIVVDFLQNDLGNVSMNSAVVDLAGNVSVASFVNIGTGMVLFPFASFVGAADLTEVDVVQFKIEGINATDMSIDFIELQSLPVPEPTTLLAAALLLLPFGARTIRGLRKTR